MMAATSPRLILDVSLTHNLRGSIGSGIPRVEHRVADALLRRSGINAAFCRYRSRHGSFQLVPASAVREMLRQPRVRAVSYGPARAQSRVKRLGKVLEKAWRRYLVPPRDLVEWSPDDIYVSVGAWWNAAYDEAMASLFADTHVRKILMCHDTMPIRFPEYFEDPESALRFREALKIFASAELVVCNSKATESDLLAALSEAGLGKPVTLVVPLPPGISPQSTEPQRPSGLPDGEFVLTVGSISRRKNQLMLCDVWSRLRNDPALAGIKLVIGGGWGEHSAAVRDRLQRDSELATRVIVLDGTTDDELAWLYRHSLFTLFPSFYEGWGLPVCESLSFGKLCIASDTSAMPEAGQGLCVHLSPDDPESWHETISGLLLNRARLAAHEQEIRSKYVSSSWDQVVERIVGTIKQ